MVENEENAEIFLGKDEQNELLNNRKLMKSQ